MRKTQRLRREWGRVGGIRLQLKGPVQSRPIRERPQTYVMTPPIKFRQGTNLGKKGSKLIKKEGTREVSRMNKNRTMASTRDKTTKVRRKGESGVTWEPEWKKFSRSTNEGSCFGLCRGLREKGFSMRVGSKKIHASRGAQGNWFTSVTCYAF